MLGALQRGCAGGRIGAVPDTRDDLSARGAPAALLVPFPQKEGERRAIWLLELSGEPWALRVLRLPAGWVSLGLGALPLFLDPWCGARGGAGLCLAVASSSGVDEPAGHLGALGHLPCGAAGWRVPWWGQCDGVGCGVVLYLQGLTAAGQPPAAFLLQPGLAKPQISETGGIYLKPSACNPVPTPQLPPLCSAPRVAPSRCVPGGRFGAILRAAISLFWGTQELLCAPAPPQELLGQRGC